MFVQILGINLKVSEALRLYTDTRMRTAIRRFADRVGRVTVRIGDCNADRGGVDKVCSVEASLGSAGTVFVEQTDANAYVAVDAAATRLKQVLARRMRLQWESHRPRVAGDADRALL